MRLCVVDGGEASARHSSTLREPRGHRHLDATIHKLRSFSSYRSQVLVTPMCSMTMKEAYKCKSADKSAQAIQALVSSRAKRLRTKLPEAFVKGSSRS